ncbi:Hypothetical predicted protein [Pelobates cultripes]|uniref:Uncharacterized protein n=1 Tax=Pelobates cultripes TaxID=61616 RepID=A0AAD1TI92_PELCU|nr:Hypothetical predicted protein [Pelobates cultripes]
MNTTIRNYTNRPTTDRRLKPKPGKTTECQLGTISGLQCQRDPPGTQDHPIATLQTGPGQPVIGANNPGILWPAVH